MERHLPRDTVVLNPEFMEHADDDEGLDLEEGECSVCGRDTKLTRHHMIPRSTLITHAHTHTRTHTG